MISVAVPVYNEAESLPILAERVTGVLGQIGQPWELIFINDGSQDGSEEVLDRLASENTNIKIVHFRRNYGQTAAMMAGFDFAKGDVIIPLDGDLQNDPSDIPKLLAKLYEGFDVCSGWRKDRQDNALQRNLPSIMANRLISFVSGVELHDFGCSLKAYRSDVIKDVRLYGEMHRFLPIYAYWHGAKITEVVVKFLDSFAEKPMYVFGAVGMLSFFVSFASGAAALYLKLYAAKSFIETPLPLLCVMSGITGVMCFLMGLLAEMIMRTFYESQGKSVYSVRETRNVEPRR